MLGVGPGRRGPGHQLTSGLSGPGPGPRPGQDRPGAAMAKRDYLVEAAKQIRMALDREVNEDYEAAFSYYKNGVDLLLNGVQVDPNGERREAVKRKTTQYLKRAEEIFISHLQDNLGKGSAHLGGYSSLRFRPIRHLSSPVEDLEMCKVVGIVDKVLTVQSLVNKETFVVKSLAKSSWETRDQPTIIPQGVPFMVRLLRYYVSQDAVYLHLEHVQGGRLFSKLHRFRSDRAKEHPECISPAQRGVPLRTSYSSPAISIAHQQGGDATRSGTTGMTVLPEGEVGDEGADRDSSPASWDETQQRLDSCGTHSYCEETGCLRNPRSAASRSPPSSSCASSSSHAPSSSSCASSSSRAAPSSSSSSLAGLVRTGVGSCLPPRPPPPGRCLGSEPQGESDLPIQPFIGQALDVTSERLPPFGPAEPDAYFDMVAWNASDRVSNDGGSLSHCATIEADTAGADRPLPRTSYTAPGQAGSTANTGQLADRSGSHDNGSSSPATLHLPLHSQSHVVLTSVRCHRGGCGSGGGLVDTATGLVVTSHPGKEGDGLATEEGRVRSAVGSTADGSGSSTTADGASSGRGPCPRTAGGQQQDPHPPGAPLHPPGAPLHLAGVHYPRPGDEVEEGWELLSPGGRDPDAPPQAHGPPQAPHPSTHPPGGGYPQSRRGDMDAFLRSEGLEEEEEEGQVIEVEGWCHLPRAPRSGPRGREGGGGWGLPEGEVRLLGAQILLALESLHQQGIICRDLNPKNVLMTPNGRVCLTFFGQWSEVQSEISTMAMDQMYCAPEIGGVAKITEACDWWSLGALLFELLTGTPLWQFHPAGVRSHTQLLIPDHLSTAAASLLTELLQFDAGYRLGSGGGGVSDIKCHPFFTGVPWQTLGS